jgi:peptide/nickel transport system permease protein
MWKVVYRRLLVAVPTLFVVATQSVFLSQLVPGDPANKILGRSATPEQIQAVHAQLGIDRPVFVQYLDWLGGIFRGDLGTSYVSGTPVSSTLGQAIPPTLSLAVLATVMALVAGLLIGMIIAVRRGPLDSLARGIASLGLALPNFWVAALLILVFAVLLPIFPATGYTPLTENPGLWLLGLVLPASAIAINNFCQIVLQTRSSVLEVLSREFVRTLQAAGIPRRTILLKHVLRNAAIPVSTMTGLAFIGTLSGVVVIEAIFNSSGLGNLLLNGVQYSDIPSVQGTILVFGLLVIAVNLLIDLLNAWLDPRTRLT